MADELLVAVVAGIAAVVGASITALSGEWQKKREFRATLLGDLVPHSYKLTREFYYPMAAVSEELLSICHKILHRKNPERELPARMLYEIAKFAAIRDEFRSKAAGEFRFRHVATESYALRALEETMTLLPFSLGEVAELSELGMKLPPFHSFLKIALRDRRLAALLTKLEQWLISEDGKNLGKLNNAMYFYSLALTIGINELYATWYGFFSGYRWPTRYGRAQRKWRKELRRRYPEILD